MTHIASSTSHAYHPILFSAAMVKAILEGRKTQTRRALKPQPPTDHETLQFDRIAPTRVDRHGEEYPGDERWGCTTIDGEWCLPCPYGGPGDRLWVRESHWRFTGCAVEGKPWQGFIEAPDGNPYNARCYDDYDQIRTAYDACAVERVPSIHMPRWASRISLEITAVRLERLQEIGSGDCIAEGLHTTPDQPEAVNVLRDQYRALWESINGPESWAANPWVWVVEFRRIANG
jgi:hypothetical protein